MSDNRTPNDGDAPASPHSPLPLPSEQLSEPPLSATASGKMEESSETFPRREAGLMRTRRLILAAVRVWELKRGLRE